MALKTEWDLTPFYKSDNDPQIEKDRENELKRFKEFADKWGTRKDYLSDPDLLLEALQEYETLGMQRDYGSETYAGPVAYYWFYRSCTNQQDDAITQKYKDSENFSVELSNLVQFFTIKIAKTPKKEQKTMLEDQKLSNYHNFLSLLYQQGKYTLSEKEEKILSLTKIPAFNNWANLVEKLQSQTTVRVLDESEKRVTVPVTEAAKFLSNPDKRIRRTTGKAICKEHAKISDVAVEEINSIIQYHKITNDLKGLERPDKSRLMGDNVDERFVDTLVDATVERNHLSQRYYTLKAKLMGMKKLNYYDKVADIGKLNVEMSYEDSVKIVKKVFGEADREYAEIIMEYINNGQIDVYPKKGKMGGAFCAYGTKGLPGYVLMNHNEDVYGLTTLGHELGHAVNHELFMKHQTPLNQGSTKAIAEVSSNFFEVLALKEVEKTLKNKEDLLILKQQQIESDITSIFRQIGFYRFEQEMHKKFAETGYVSKKELGALFEEKMLEYLGPAFKFEEGAMNGWIPVVHFRLVFYVYSYASGLLIAKSLVQMYEEDKSFAKDLKYFLSQGTNLSPKEIFTQMGIDIYEKAFWDKGFKQFEKNLDQFEELAREVKGV